MFDRMSRRARVTTWTTSTHRAGRSVTVQLVNDGTSVCFDSMFDQADFIMFNDPAQFKAKAQ